GVARSASPITAIFSPPRWIGVHGSAYSGRAVPPESVMLAARKLYFAPAIRARSVPTDQSNSWLPIVAASMPNALTVAIARSPQLKIGRASCRERGESAGGADSI